MRHYLICLALLLTAGDVVAAPASSYPSKSTPTTSDKILIIDVAASNAVKTATLGSLPGGGSMTWPAAAGVAVYSGSSSWGTSLTVGTGANNLVQLNASSQLPAVSAALLTNFPTLNQSTTGTAAGLTSQYIDWNSASGGSSIANKPTIPTVSDTAYGVGWNGDTTGVASKNAIYDKIETIGTASISDTAYDATSWDGVTTVAPSKNAIRDKFESLPTLSAGTGITITPNGGGAGIDTVAVTANTYQTYNTNLTTWAGVTPGSGVGTMLAIAPGSAGGPTTTIASGTSALGTSAISSGACATAVSTTATGVATTDVINWGFNGDPTGVTGYAASANGMLTIIAYPSSGNVNYKVCNNTAASITPGAITLNWRVQR